MPRVIDFDQFRAEQHDEPVLFKIGGKEYALPSALPASLAVDIIRMKADMDADEDVPNDVMDEFGRSLFGPTIWEALLIEHRITVDELSPMIERVLEVYTSGPKDESQEPPTFPTPESGSASSNTGRGSKRTSSASTAST